MSSKQTYWFFFLKENYDTKPKKKKPSLHARNACDVASFDTNCLDLLLEINVLKYVSYK